MDVVKVVIPAGGMGGRFLPLTKVLPKEMLPVLNKPAIQVIVEEALAAHITNFSIITSQGKDSICDFFDGSPHLEDLLKERNQEHLLASVKRIQRLAEFTYFRQAEPHGLGHAVWLARHQIAKEYFGIMLPDDIIIAEQPALGQLIRIARQEKASVIAVQEVPEEHVPSYGIISIKKQITPNLFQIANLVEKPTISEAPSHLAVVGRYILSNKIFSAIEQIAESATGEIQLTTAIDQLLRMNEKVFAYKIQGKRYDIGTPLGWAQAIVSFALHDPHFGPQMRTFLRETEGLDCIFSEEKSGKTARLDAAL